MCGFKKNLFSFAFALPSVFSPMNQNSNVLVAGLKLERADVTADASSQPKPEEVTLHNISELLSEDDLSVLHNFIKRAAYKFHSQAFDFSK